MTFSQFLTCYQLFAVCKLFRDTKKQVLGIYYALGFNGLLHFNRVFKKEYGMSPSQFITPNVQPVKILS